MPLSLYEWAWYLSRTKYRTEGDIKMGKNKNSKKNHQALPKADVEFAEERGNGLEKKALRALKSPK